MYGSLIGKYSHLFSYLNLNIAANNIKQTRQKTTSLKHLQFAKKKMALSFHNHTMEKNSHFMLSLRKIRRHCISFLCVLFIKADIIWRNCWCLKGDWSVTAASNFSSLEEQINKNKSWIFFALHSFAWQATLGLWLFFQTHDDFYDFSADIFPYSFFWIFSLT